MAASVTGRRPLRVQFMVSLRPHVFVCSFAQFCAITHAVPSGVTNGIGGKVRSSQKSVQTAIRSSSQSDAVARKQMFRGLAIALASRWTVSMRPLGAAVSTLVRRLHATREGTPIR